MSQTLRGIDFDRVFITSKKTLGIVSNLCALSAFPLLCDILGTVSFFQPPADARYLVLAGEKDEDATGRQSGVNFGCFTDCIVHIV